ncbi:hypothetical protein MMC11_007667 [Xylographa trunciseda]|nr:hypothetical protein [Xylographa trunciseda]
MAESKSVSSPSQVHQVDGGEDGGEMAPRSMSAVSWLAVVVSLLSSMFLFALDNTVVAVVQPNIVRRVGDVDHLPWVSVSYALGGIADTLLVCNLFKRFDNKILFIAGVVVFEAGSAVCGAAPSMAALIVGRVICGLGGTGIYIGAMNLLSLMTTEEERPMYLGVSGLTWGLGTFLGPVIGGALAASAATWRWCFYINLCVGAVACSVYIFLIPAQNPRPGASVLSRLGEIDWAGAILNAGAAVALVMGIAFGGGLYAWLSGQIIALLVCGGVLGFTFVLQQYYAILTTKTNRLFPVRYLRSLEMTVFALQISCGITTTIFIPLYFIPLFFQFVQSQSTLAAASHLLPLVCFQVAGTVISGALLNKLGYYIVFYIAGSALALIGGALFLTATIYGYSVLLGLGAGLYTQLGYPVAELKVSRVEIPEVVTFLGFAQIAAIVLALTISSSFFLNDATARIAAILPDVPHDVVQQGILGTSGQFFATIPDAQRKAVLGAIVHTISNAYGMVVAAGAFAFLLALTMKRERLAAPVPTRNEVDDSKQ